MNIWKCIKWEEFCRLQLKWLTLMTWGKGNSIFVLLLCFSWCRKAWNRQGRKSSTNWGMRASVAPTSPGDTGLFHLFKSLSYQLSEGTVSDKVLKPSSRLLWASSFSLSLLCPWLLWSPLCAQEGKACYCPLFFFFLLIYASAVPGKELTLNKYLLMNEWMRLSWMMSFVTNIVRPHGLLLEAPNGNSIFRFLELG